MTRATFASMFVMLAFTGILPATDHNTGQEGGGPPSGAELEIYAARLTAAEALLRLDEVEAAEEQLQRIPPGWRGWEWRFLNSRLDRSLETLPVQAGTPRAVRFRGDGQTLAAVDGQGLVIWDATAGTVVEQRPFAQPLPATERVLISEDHRYVALMTQETQASRSEDRAAPEGLPTKEEIAAQRRPARLVIIDTATGEPVAEANVAPLDGFVFSADATRLAIRHVDGEIEIIETASGEELVELDVPGSLSGAIALNRDGSTLAAVEEGATLAMRNAASGELITQIRIEPAALIDQLAFAPDARSIAITSVRGWVFLHHLEDHRTVPLRQQSQRAASLAFSDDGGMLAVLFESGRFELLDVATGTLITSGRGLPVAGDAVDLAAAGTLVATCAREGVKLYAAAPTAEVLTLPHRDAIVSVAFSPRGDQLLVAPLTGPMRSRDARTGEIIEAFGDRTRLGEATWSRDGSRIFAATRNDEVRVWDAAEASIIGSHVIAVETTAVALNGDGLVATGDRHGVVRVFSLDGQGNELRADRAVFERPVSALAFSEDGSRLAAAARDGSVALLSAPAFDAPLNVARLDRAALRMSFNPSGDTLATGGIDGVIHLFDVNQAAPVRRLAGHEGAVLALDFSPDGARLASGGMDRTLRIWLVSQTQAVMALRHHRRPITCAAWSPDGSRLASGDLAGDVLLWDDRPASSLVSTE